MLVMVFSCAASKFLRRAPELANAAARNSFQGHSLALLAANLLISALTRESDGNQ
jgi:hypothetical protein